ncbi:GlxA family transcriptional regulator [Neisseriaceae bacterium TC5R-5]|nr:GlxA family transcriptional regulator [Neisseriaceae bacterium TC5R-5]
MDQLSRFTATLRYGFLLLPQASMADLAIAIEVLLQANRLAGRALYQTLLLTLDGQPAKLSNGVELKVDCALSSCPELDCLLLLSDSISPGFDSESLSAGIGRYQSAQIKLGGIGCGSFWLAHAGYLNQRRATIHWREISRFAEASEEVIVSSNLYEVDAQRLTCPGGAATFDFMLAQVGERQEREFIAQLSEQFTMERIRSGQERQRIPLASRFGASQPKLTEAVRLMEANIAEPLSTDDIAHYVGFSRRQLERLFKQYLQTVPSKYYLELRLNRAKQLLQQSSKPIIQIAQDCGFASGPHFSSSYRNHFRLTPSQERMHISRLTAAK